MMKKWTRALAMILIITMVCSCLNGVIVSTVNATGHDVDHTGWTAVSLNGGNGTTAISACGSSTSGHWYFNTNGKYYLTEDIALNITVYVYPGDTMSLDLNGFNLSSSSGDKTVLNIKSNATLNLYGTGTDLTYWKLGDDKVAEIVENPATSSSYDFTTTGGAITNGLANAVGGGGVFIQQGGVLNMYGGNIVGNICNNSGRMGGGLYNYCGTVNMYGGMIAGNSATTAISGGVYNRAGSEFNMYGGSIAYNYSANYGAGMYNVGTFNMSGGTIEYNTAVIGGGGVSTISTMNLSGGTIQYNNSDFRCGGVFIATNGTLNMSDGLITGNTSGSGGEAGVGVVYDTSTLNMSGGEISGNTSTGASAGVGYTNGSFTLSGDAVIDGNNVVDSAGDTIGASNTYISNGKVITVEDTFTGTVGVTAGTGLVAYGDDFTVGDDGDLMSDNSAYYLVKVDGNVELQAAQTATSADGLTYSGEVNLSQYFSHENNDTTYSLIGGTGTGAISGDTLDPTVAGTFIIEAVTPYSEDNAPTTETLTLEVTAKTVTISDIEAVGTVVNGKVELDNTSGSIAGAVSGDDVSIDFTVAYGSFTNGDYVDGVEDIYDVTVHDIALSGADAGVYAISAVDDTEVEIKIATPYIAWPTAKDITYGDDRAQTDLVGGQVMIKSGESWIDITAAGHFEWVTAENENAGTHTYEVKFVLDTGNTNYSSYSEYTDELAAVTHNITQTVHMAEVEFVITGNVGTSSSGLSIVAKNADGETVPASDYRLYFATYNSETGAYSWNMDWSKTQTTPTAVGSYLIAADFTANSTITPNYVHAGTMESYAKQVGGMVIYSGDAPTTYSVTFDGYESYNITGATSEDIHILPAISGYSAWQTTWEGVTTVYEFGSRFPQPDHNVVFTPASAVSTGGDISGTITGTDLDGSTGTLSGVVVALVQGPDQVAITSTDENGNYKFENMPQGRYDLVVTRDYVIRNEETVYIELTSNALEVEDITLPDTRQNTIFNVAAGMTAITVDGMKALITGAETIRSIKVELETATVAETTDILTAAAADALTADNCKLFIDLSIQERLSDATSYGEIAALGSDEYLTFYIPLAGIYQGYDNYIVYQDDGSVAKLSSTVNANSEYATVSTDGSLLTLHVQSSGIYGLGFYDNAEETLTAEAKSTTYTAEPIDINTIFTEIASDGARTYVITGGTGEGTIDSDGMLTVTKAGTFNITVNVAATADDKSIKGTGTLTVTPKEVSITGITCVDTGAGEVDGVKVDINEGGRISGAEDGDQVYINFTDGTATITDTNFADDTTLTTTGENTFDTTVTGLSLTGADAANYTLSTATIPSQVTLTTTVDTSEVYIAWPTATDLVYGETQSHDDLYGGKVMVRQTDGTYVDITDCGSFEWDTLTTETAVGTYEYTVKFVEDTDETKDKVIGTAYQNDLSLATQNISQTVQPAAVTFTITESTLEFGTALTITATDENEKTLVQGTDYWLYYQIDGVWNLTDLNQSAPTAVGTYLVGASLTDNYHHAGTLESIAKQIGVFTIYDSATSEAPATYSVTFQDENGDAMSGVDALTDALPDTIHNLPTLTNEDADGNLLYTGWLLNGTTYEFEGRYTQPAENVTFTAIAAPAKTSTIYGTVSGTDLDQTIGFVSRVGVALYQGSTLIETDETDSSGEYSFTVAPGMYNVVVTWYVGETTYQMTQFVDASADDAVVCADFTLADILQNVVLEVTKGLLDIVVEGLESLVNTTMDSEVVMQITPNTTDDQTTVDSIVAYAVARGIAQSDVKLFMNIDVTHNDVVVDDTGDLMTFYIPLTGTFQGNEEYTVYRYHDGAIHTLTETANNLGEYIKVSDDKTNLEIHARLYSLYGIAFANEDPTSSGSTNIGTIVTPDVTEDATDNTDTDTDSNATSGLPFIDVDEDDWFYDAVAYVYYADLMNGISTTVFSPNLSTTRGMIATILYRMEGSPEFDGEMTFTDVADGSYYEDAIAWAQSVGVVTGYSDEIYKPDQNVSREQLAAIMYRYANYLELDVSVGESTDLSGYTDEGDISAYAVPAMEWACGSGLISGMTNTTLEPDGYATRAQVATILMRFLSD